MFLLPELHLTLLTAALSCSPTQKSHQMTEKEKRKLITGIAVSPPAMEVTPAVTRMSSEPTTWQETDGWKAAVEAWASW